VRKDLTGQFGDLDFLTRFGVFLALSVVMSATMTMPVKAFEVFGLCLFGNCKHVSVDVIDPVLFEVEVTIENDIHGVDDAVRSSSALWTNRRKAAAGTAGLLATAQGDYKRILAGLYNDARYGGEISIRINGREAADLDLSDRITTPAMVEIFVSPVEQFRFGTTDIAPQAPPARSNDSIERPEATGFAPGETAFASTVKKAERLTIDAWRQQGYAKARIGEQSVSADHPDRLLNVQMAVEPGPKAHYGPIEVTGTERMIPSFVARQTGLKPGQEYDPDDLDRARERLRRLGVFSTASLKEQDSIGSDGLLPLTLSVQERKLRRIGVGATLSSIDGVGAQAYWLHRNLWGRAERLRLEASVSGIDSTIIDEFDYNAGATLTLPGRFTPDTDVTLQALATRETFDAYRKSGAEVSLSLVHFQTKYLTLSGGTFVDYSQYDTDAGSNRYGVVGAVAGAEFDSRDNPLDAKSGYYANAELTPLYEWEFNHPALRIDSEVRGYWSPDSATRSVVAGRVRLGSVIAHDDAALPPDRLYLAGGGGSVRGYPYKSIGVDDETGLAAGRSLVEGSLELRQKVGDKIGVVAFADAGIVSATSVPDFDDDILYSAGIGVRYDTGLGPIRLDVAVPLTKRDDDPDFAVYAGIGQAF